MRREVRADQLKMGDRFNVPEWHRPSSQCVVSHVARSETAVLLSVLFSDPELSDVRYFLEFPPDRVVILIEGE